MSISRASELPPDVGIEYPFASKTTTTSNHKRLSWVDQIMIQFGTPTDEEIANAERSIPNVWDEERVTWAEVHATLIKNWIHPWVHFIINISW